MTSNPSHLRELSLRENQSLTDADVKLLSSAMMHPNCRLETLRLWDCSLSEISCDSLASALRSNPSHLRVLDLGGNQLKDPAVKLLCGALQDPLCELETLRSVRDDPVLPSIRMLQVIRDQLWLSGLGAEVQSLPSQRTGPGWEPAEGSGVKLLCGFLSTSKLPTGNSGMSHRLMYCRLSEISCGSLASALRSNPSHLRKLDLSENQLQDSGVKLLCVFLHFPNCRLETLGSFRREGHTGTTYS
ncbi:Ribonuclease inhibitor [Takifugu flavidus]|uniref:Ribonuclease inhibitor n=1 Tax=Takifugu flavidus TaxID=433684 RepID=A0A5C6MHJ5_9TELE|nr:Ribonuclease inhibitor [Takifugu flavidus]